MKKSMITIATMVTALGAFALAPMASADTTVDVPGRPVVSVLADHAINDASTTTRTHSVKHKKALAKHYTHTHRDALKHEAKKDAGKTKAGNKTPNGVGGN